MTDCGLNGDRNYMGNKRIIDKLTSDGALFRCQGILECIDKDIKDPEVINAVSQLKDDKVIVLGRRVSTWARTALDVLGVEAYIGDDEEVLDFIRDMKRYLEQNDRVY